MGRLGQTVKRCLTFATGLVECLGFAGVVAGWPTLVYVLKRDQYFAGLCETAHNSSHPGAPNATTDCTLQDERFTLIYTIATFVMNVASIAIGFLLDYCGTMATRFVAISLYTAATLMIAFSTAASAMLLFPALTLLGLGGFTLLMSNTQVGNLFGSRRSTVITLYDGAYDSSPAVFMIVKVLYEAGFSLRSIFLVISCLSVLHIARTIFLMPWTHIPYPAPEGYTYGATCEIFKLIAFSHEERALQQSPGDAGTTGTGSGRMAKTRRTAGERGAVERPMTGGDVGERMEQDERRRREGRTESQGDMGESHGVDGGNFQPNGAECSVAKENQDSIPSFRNCVFSRLCLTHLLWLSLIQLRHFLFIGTLNPMLNLMTGRDPRKVSRFTNAFAFTQLCAIFCAPWNGLILDRHKRRGRRLDSVTAFPDRKTPTTNNSNDTGQSDSVARQRLEDVQSAVLSLAITVTLSTLFSLCAAIPVLEVQYLTFVLQVINAAFLYGSDAAFLAIAFPTCHFGKLYGTTQALAGVFCLLQYPCFILVKGPLQDNPLYMNVAFIALVTLAFAHPLNVHLWCRREKLMRPG